MEIKKSKKASLENKRLLFTEIGLIVALLAVWGAFSYSTREKKVSDLLDVNQDIEVEEMVPITGPENPYPF